MWRNICNCQQLLVIASGGKTHFLTDSHCDLHCLGLILFYFYFILFYGFLLVWLGTIFIHANIWYGDNVLSSSFLFLFVFNLSFLWFMRVYYNSRCFTICRRCINTENQSPPSRWPRTRFVGMLVIFYALFWVFLKSGVLKLCLVGGDLKPDGLYLFKLKKSSYLAVDNQGELNINWFFLIFSFYHRNNLKHNKTLNWSNFNLI